VYLVFSPDGQTLFSTDEYGTGYLWDDASAQKTGQLAGLHGDGQAAISRSGGKLAVAAVTGASVWPAS
jgi:hypothetical protein